MLGHRARIGPGHLGGRRDLGAGLSQPVPATGSVPVTASVAVSAGRRPGPADGWPGCGSPGWRLTAGQFGLSGLQLGGRRGPLRGGSPSAAGGGRPGAPPVPPTSTRRPPGRWRPARRRPVPRPRRHRRRRPGPGGRCGPGGRSVAPAALVLALVLPVLVLAVPVAPAVRSCCAFRSARPLRSWRPPPALAPVITTGAAPLARAGGLGQVEGDDPARGRCSSRTARRTPPAARPRPAYGSSGPGRAR